MDDVVVGQLQERSNPHHDPSQREDDPNFFDLQLS
jgi:hypothetical protein